MAHKMTRRGSLDNVITYEHYCDTRADMADIPQNEINLGTICLVLKGTAGLEVYMATSDKEWIDISSIGTGSSTPTSSGVTSDIVGQGTADNMTLQG